MFLCEPSMVAQTLTLSGLPPGNPSRAMTISRATNRATVPTPPQQRRRTMSALEARISLVLALASQTSSVSQRLLVDLATETAKYVFPKRFEARNLEEALMSVPDLETVKFRVLSRTDQYEIREVEPYFIAEATMPGKSGFDFNGASQSFNLLAEYLFGKNTRRETMEMTTPVFTHKARADGEKMEMTTPVITKRTEDQEKWQMSFVLPSKYGADLPLPKDASVRIKEVPRKIVAVVAFSGGLQVGGGINSDNALSYITEGASHVIVTSYVFNNGKMDLDRLKDLVRVVGKERLVLDLSCRKKEGRYAIVTDRWQKFSDVYLDEEVLDFLAKYADEFLVHGVDVEGKKLGIDEELVALLGKHSPIPVTYAGGVTVMADLETITTAGLGRVDVTVGSALDIFGGNMAYRDVVAWHAQQQALTV